MTMNFAYLLENSCGATKISLKIEGSTFEMKYSDQWLGSPEVKYLITGGAKQLCHNYYTLDVETFVNEIDPKLDILRDESDDDSDESDSDEEKEEEKRDEGDIKLLSFSLILLDQPILPSKRSPENEFVNCASGGTFNENETFDAVMIPDFVESFFVDKPFFEKFINSIRGVKMYTVSS